MSDEYMNMRYFTPRMVDVALSIWMRSSITLMDVRSKMIEQNKPLENYLLPTSTIIYTYGTSARITLHQKPYQTGHYGLCHAGKGTRLSIYPLEADIQAYMILYKTEAVPFYKRHLRDLLEEFNPFTQVYGFSPTNPVFFMERFRSMYENWSNKESIGQFYAKVLLYQIIHQIYTELRLGGIRYIEPDYVQWIKEYLDQHYAEPISIQTLSDQLPISRSLLGRLFRKRENSSLQEYLIMKRIAAAQAYLEHSHGTLQEIACGCGFTNELNMNRMFNRYLHMTPGEYRRKRLFDRTRNEIDNDSRYSYNEKELVYPVKSTGDEDFEMNSRRRYGAAAFLLGTALLLSACSGANGVIGESGGTGPTPSALASSSNAIAKQGQSSNEQQASTRRFQHIFGEIEAPVTPQRVAGVWMEDHLLALGIELIVDSVSDRYRDHYLQSRMSNSATVIEPGNVDFEALMATEPDLIVLAFPYIAEGQYDLFQKIAPTYVFDNGAWADWRSTLRLTGELTGRQAQAEQFIERYERKAAEGRENLHAALGDETVALIRVEDKSLRLYGKMTDYAGSVLYADLGLNPPEIVKKFVQGKDSSPEFSMELIPDIDADHLFVTVYESDESQQKLKEMYNSPLWRELPAVRNGNVHEVEMGQWMTAGPIASDIKVDDVLNALLK